MSYKAKPNICGSCGGKGKYQEMGIENCGKCLGTGRDLKSDIWAEPCMYCNGSGKKTYCRWVNCKPCMGSGYKY